MDQNDYSQPDFYRFNSDSLALVKYILSEKKETTPESVLDFGAGCGVIAIELALVFKSIVYIEFIEVQAEYNPYIRDNMKRFLPHCSYKILNCKFSEYKTTRKFDIVVSNPPYFDPIKGRKAQDYKRQIARSFEFDNLSILVNRMSKAAMKANSAFLVYPHTDIEQLDMMSERKRLARIGIYLII